MWGPLQESVLSTHHVGPTCRMQAISLDSKRLSLAEPSRWTSFRVLKSGLLRLVLFSRSITLPVDRVQGTAKSLLPSHKSLTPEVKHGFQVLAWPPLPDC